MFEASEWKKIPVLKSSGVRIGQRFKNLNDDSVWVVRMALKWKVWLSKFGDDPKNTSTYTRRELFRIFRAMD